MRNVLFPPWADAEHDRGKHPRIPADRHPPRRPPAPSAERAGAGVRLAEGVFHQNGVAWVVEFGEGGDRGAVFEEECFDGGGKKMWIGITKPCVRITKPCVGITKPCVRITKPCVGITKPCDVFGKQTVSLCRRTVTLCHEMTSLCGCSISLCEGVTSLCGWTFSLCRGTDSLCQRADSLCQRADSLCRHRVTLCGGREIAKLMYETIAHAVADSAKLATLLDDVVPRLLGGRVRVVGAGSEKVTFLILSAS